MTDDVLDQEFIARLKSGYRHVRKHRVQTLLDHASADGIFNADERRRYLAAALEFDPKPMAIALHNIFGDETAAPKERRGAASLYLHGGGKGWWKMRSSVAELARSLLNPAKGQPMKPAKDQTMKQGRRKISPKEIAAIVSDDHLSRLLAATRAGATMEAACNDPASTPAMQLDAIDRWMRIASQLVPDEFGAGMGRLEETDPLTTKGVN